MLNEPDTNPATDCDLSAGKEAGPFFPDLAKMKISDLSPYKQNARTHSRAQIRKIADSIRQFGFTNPVLIDKTNNIVAGHGRVEAAKLLELLEVPTLCLEHLTPAQVRAYVIADNRLALDAGWDEDILRIELQNIILENEIDVSLTGFEVGEIDVLLADSEGPTEEEIPELESDAVTRLGDLWQLGPHRVFCGDCRAANSFQVLMGSEKANVVFSDPPYNVVIDGHASGNGRTQHREFAMASGEMSKTEFTDFLRESFKEMAQWSVDGSVHYLCMDWRHMGEMLDAGNAVYDSLLNLCVWAKDVGGMGSFYRSRHELVFVFRKGKELHQNNVQLGKFGRNRTNVWEYPGANTLSRHGDEGNLVSMHPTVKPIALVADAILDSSSRGDIVLDSFLGSGSTLLAAERTGRRCFGLEIDPRYVDLIIRRWQQHTGDTAIHIVSGASFAKRSVQEVSHA